MIKGKENFYLGIDLGTTNTVMSYGRISPRTNELTIQSVRLDVIDENKSIAKTEILPSCIYFKKGDNPIVGPFAKGMLATQGSRVVSSIKSKMGEEHTITLDNKDYQPEDISALILKYIANLSKKTLRALPEDVIITVPASFNSDQKNATIKAAEEAGFKVKNNDGSPRNILLNEPRAALFNFVHEWKNNKIPQTSITLDEPKNILVFDLGGGTLDVSFHNLDYDFDNDKVNVKDYAISRYTQIGGDDFDKALAVYYREHLEKKGLKYNKLDEVRKTELDKKLVSIAEGQKIEFNTDIYRTLDFGDEEDLEELDLSATLKNNVYDNLGLDIEMDFLKYREIIKHHLGDDLKLEDYKKINDLNFEDNNNIIFPILDVMSKAEKKLGKMPKIDAVLLNGGMSKLYYIQKRIEDFFGFKPITATDEDKAVAYGATYYHYSLHQGIKYGSIQNESIGIEIKGEIVKHLVEAGEELPCSINVPDNFEIQDSGATTLVLPFYLGERNDTKEPNKKIASRRIVFDKPLNAGEKISLKVELNEAGLMTIVGYKEGQEDQPFEVQIESNKIEDIKSVQGEKIEGYQIKKFVKKEIKKPMKTGEILEVYTTAEQLKAILKQKKIDHSKFKNLSNKIKDSINGYEFINLLLTLSENFKNEAKSKVIVLLGDLIKYYDDYREDVAKELISNLEVSKIYKICGDDNRNINRIIRDYVNAIGKSEMKFTESSLLSFFNDPLSDTIKNDVVVALGKCGYSKNTLLYLMEHYNDLNKISKDIDPQRLLWALAKLCSREKEHPIDIKPIYMLIDKTLISFKTKITKEIFEKLAFLIGEMCDSRFGNSISEEYQIEVLKAIDSVYNSKNTKQRKLLDIIKLMVLGTELDKEQQDTLLAIRTTL